MQKSDGQLAGIGPGTGLLTAEAHCGRSSGDWGGRRTAGTAAGAWGAASIIAADTMAADTMMADTRTVSGKKRNAAGLEGFAEAGDKRT